MIAVADTGFVAAIGNRKDRHHRVCLESYRRVQTIYLTQSVLTESAFILMGEAGIPLTAKMLQELGKTKYKLIALELEDVSRSAALLLQYADSKLDFVDATVVAICERLNITTVLTIDRRDFSMIRPAHTTHFDLLPEKLG